MPLPAPAPDSTVLITGASAGIGTELARVLAARGFGLTLVARRRERLKQLAVELGPGVRTEIVVCDLAEVDQRDALVARVAELGLTVEVLVNNAGFGSGAPFVKLDRERELRMLRLNCEAVIDLCFRYVPGMVTRGRGAVLNVASTVAFQPLTGQSTYAASKALVLSFTESLHHELSGSRVLVTALCPGPVRTEFADVAGLGPLESSTPDFLWSSARQVAEAGIRGLESGDRVVVPGALNGLGAIVGRHAPRGLFLRAAKRFYPVGRE